jgi:putative transposase
VLTEFGLKIAPSTYYAALTRPPSARAVRDEELMEMIDRIYRENYSVYGARKVWWQLRRDGVGVGRGRVERLMRRLGLAGVVRGKTVRTTVSDKDGLRAADLVKRQFAAGAPNRLWVADFTYVNAWAGTVYVAFAIDVFSRKIVGWRARMSKEADLVLDAIDMGLRRQHYRPGPGVDKLVHHSDAGSQPGLNRSSQHLEREVRYGTRARLGSKNDGQAADAVAGSTTLRSQRTSEIVLGNDLAGRDEYRRGAHGRRVGGRWHAVVPRMWRRETSVGLSRGLRPFPVVCRA